MGDGWGTNTLKPLPQNPAPLKIQFLTNHKHNGDEKADCI
jgi:hypothetical protein